LGIPIIVRTKVLGLVVIWDANPERYFRLQDKQFLSAIVNIAGFALENTYLYDYIVEKNGAINFYERITPGGKDKHTVKNMIFQLLGMILSKQKCPHVGIFIRSQNNNKWHLFAEQFEKKEFSDLGVNIVKNLIYLKDNIFDESDYLFWHEQLSPYPLDNVLKTSFTKFHLNSALVFPFSVEHLYYGLLVIGLEKSNSEPPKEELQFYRFMYFILRQLVEKKALMDYKNRYEAYIQHLEKMKIVGELASGSAHHLNNILSVILGKSQILQKKITDLPLLKDLKTIEQAASDGAQAIKRLQRVKAPNEFSGKKQIINIADLLQEVIEIAKPRFEREAQSLGITYDMQLTLGSDYFVYGDAAALREVVLNLINNALDAMPKGGKLSIQTTLKNDKVVIFFSDTGHGITENVKEKIFEPFYSTKGEKGNGLGLSIAAEVLANHNGRIYVDSIPGKGSIFMVELPAVDKDMKSEEKSSEVFDKIGCRVLLVDDENVVRETLTEMLEDEGCEVIIARNAKEGIARFQEFGCDVVLTDLSMPGANGYELAKQIKSIQKDVPIILITGWNQVNQTILKSKSFIDGIIEKPLNINHIKEEFTRLLKPNGQLDRSTSLEI
jgi:signal transduction histidine kinase/CheY-like chemotaxis protein